VSAAPAPIVVKFGGTSLGTAARVRRAARRVARRVSAGTPVLVVVSARGQTTDRILSDLARLGRVDAADRETDRALSTGEDLSAALLAAALAALGVKAVSLRGVEAGIHAGGAFGRGRIERVVPGRLRVLLSAGSVPVVSGFQGGRADGETVTLGRGGSDTSAVALAAALGPVPCEIVTDVEAVCDRDPRINRDARRYASLSHAELRRLAEAGAEVIQPEAARLAERLGVPLRVYSFRAPLADGPYGTRIRPERAEAPGQNAA
jgi:aspartate kinase